MLISLRARQQQPATWQHPTIVIVNLQNVAQSFAQAAMCGGCTALCSDSRRRLRLRQCCRATAELAHAAPVGLAVGAPAHLLPARYYTVAETD